MLQLDRSVWVRSNGMELSRQFPELETVLATLFGTRPLPTIHVAVSAVRAVYDAYDLPAPNLIELATRHGARLSGSEFVADRPVLNHHDEDAHGDVARVLYVGAPDLAKVAPDLIVHALFADETTALHCLRRAIEAVRRSRSAGLLAQVYAIYDALDDSHRFAAAFGYLTARTSLNLRTSVLDEEVIARLERVMRVLEARGDTMRAAEIALSASTNVPSHHIAPMRDAVERLSPNGWQRADEILGVVHSNDMSHDVLMELRQVVAHAVRTGNDYLASAMCLQLGVAHQFLGHAAIASGASPLAWMGRAGDLATASNWTLRVRAMWAKSASLMYDLRLVEAHAELQRLREFVANEGLESDARRVELLFAEHSATVGDPHDVKQMQAVDANPTNETNVIQAIRLAIAAAVVEFDGAWEMVASARAQVAQARDVNGYPYLDIHQGQLLVADMLLDRNTSAWLQLAERLRSDQSITHMAAVMALAHRVVLDPAPDYTKALRAVVETAQRGHSRFLDLALDGAAAALSGNWRSLEAVHVRMEQSGLLRDAGYFAAAAGACAADAGNGNDADRLFNFAYRRFARLGLRRGARLVRDARMRASQMSRERRPSSSAGSFMEAHPQLQARIDELKIPRTVPRGEAFPLNFVTSIADGLATVEVAATGAVVDVVGAGTTVNVEEIVDPAAAGDWIVRAVTPCAISVFPVEVLAHEASRSDELHDELVRCVLQRQRAVAERMRAMLTMSGEQRVAATLLRVFEVTGDVGGRQRIRVPRVMLAALAGTSRETASRVIASLVRDGSLGVDGRALVLEREDALSARAEFAR